MGAGAALLVGGVGTAAAEGEDEAGLRVAHASPNAPKVDVLVDGDAVVEGLEFRSVTDYLELEPGTYEVAVEPAGGGDPVFGPGEIELEGEDYTAVARGEVGDDTDTEFTVSLFEDTNGANIGDDEARVRAIHASPDAPAVDVTAVTDVDDDGDDETLTVFDDFSFGESSGYAVVPATDYTVELRAEADDDRGPVVETVDVSLDGGATYTVFAVGYLTVEETDEEEAEPADEPLELLPTLDKGAPPRGDGDEDDEDRDDGNDGDDEDDEDDGDDNGRGRGRGNGRGRGRGD